MTQLLKYQHWHLLSLMVLLAAVYSYITQAPSLLYGELYNINTSTWLALAILAPIFHQVYVLICWRLELFYKSLSKTFGSKAFRLYKIGFAVLFASRLITIILLAISSKYTFYLDTTLALIAAVILLVPSVYLFYSVKMYFGFNRAFGIDHFQPEKFKDVPFVKRGIFKYTSNGMYIYGFLLLYIPGLLLLSKAAILAALFNHIYIWVHYFFTEAPDMEVIYGEG